MEFTWSGLDAFAAALLLPLAIWLLVSGFDDLFVDAAGLVAARRLRKKSGRPSRRQLLSEPQKPIAIIVPLWHEDSVIEQMVQRNTHAVLYRNYHIFIGAYPNDEPTLREVRKLEKRYPNVHLAVCPHDGPTSKADCLNWIFQHLLAYERKHGERFEILVTHDAEDVIHSDSLHWINHYSGEFEMVQIPVLPIPTPLTQWTHGVYIDEFTEYQTRDMPARQLMGAFVPSNGVGTGFRRDALDALAEAGGNRVFEPVCLTEDYENGLRLRLQGAKQLFLALHTEGLATREYFPQTMRSAIRQKTRWVTGIALQSWDRHGWSTGLVQRYWLWRDRKGLIGNPASLLTNALFAYGSGRWLWGAAPPDAPLLTACAALGAYRVVYRMWCVRRVYGWGFALTTPFRVVVGNIINSAATWCALRRFATAKLRGLPLVWVKTAHEFPNQAELVRASAKLGEMLVANGYVTQAELDRGLQTKPAHVRTGEHLVNLGYLDEDALYEALSLQQALPQSRVEPAQVKALVARSLPAKLIAQIKVVPFRVDAGRLFVGSPELPTPDIRERLAEFTSLRLEFHLITPANYRALVSALL